MVELQNEQPVKLAQIEAPQDFSEQFSTFPISNTEGCLHLRRMRASYKRFGFVEIPSYQFPLPSTFVKELDRFVISRGRWENQRLERGSSTVESPEYIYVGYSDRFPLPCPSAPSLVSLFNSAQVSDLLRAVTGINAIEVDVVQLNAYRVGDSLEKHCDCWEGDCSFSIIRQTFYSGEPALKIFPKRGDPFLYDFAPDSWLLLNSRVLHEVLPVSAERFSFVVSYQREGIRELSFP